MGQKREAAHHLLDLPVIHRAVYSSCEKKNLPHEFCYIIFAINVLIIVTGEC